MSELSEKDWGLINAYHDGELGADDLRAFENRIDDEPALARALKDVCNVSSSLAALRPDHAAAMPVSCNSASNSNWRPAKWLAGAVVAAAISAAVMFGPSLAPQPTAVDIHNDFTKQTFAVQDGNLRAIAAGGHEGVPDLASANLTPVAIRALETGLVTHYAGQRGCRFSYFRGAFAVDDLSGQVRTWMTADEVHHTIVASGMDSSRFEAIASYLVLTTQNKASESRLAAISDATATAAPCIG